MMIEMLTLVSWANNLVDKSMSKPNPDWTEAKWERVTDPIQAKNWLSTIERTSAYSQISEWHDVYAYRQR